MRIFTPIFLLGCQNGPSTPSAINVNPTIQLEKEHSPENKDKNVQIEEIRSAALVYAKGVFSNAKFDKFTKTDREKRIFFRSAAQMLICPESNSLTAEWGERNFSFVSDHNSLQITEVVAQDHHALVYIVEQIDGENTDESIIVALRKDGNSWCIQSEIATNFYLQ